MSEQTKTIGNDFKVRTEKHISHVILDSAISNIVTLSLLNKQHTNSMKYFQVVMSSSACLHVGVY